VTYKPEFSDLRQELELSQAGTITYWPTVMGVGYVNIAAGDPHTYTVNDTAGTELESGSVNATLDVDVSKLSISVSAITTLGEGYSVRIAFTHSGTRHFDVVYFDVVKWPYQEKLLTLSDLMRDRPDIHRVCDRLGNEREQTAEQVGAEFGYQARVEVWASIRDQVRTDRESAAPAVTHSGTDYGKLYTRPRLILNRESIRRVERKIAVSLVYQADMKGAEDDSALLYEHFSKQAQMAWRGVGPFEYDRDEDLVPEETIVDPLRGYSTRRVQS